MSGRFGWVFLLLALIVVNFLASLFHTRIDLTKEKRYTLSQASRDLAAQLDEPLLIEVFLKGEFPAGFQKLAQSTDDFLQLLKDRNSSKISYRFISPKEEQPTSVRPYADTLVGLGASPINLTVQLKDGQQQNYVFPVALMHYKGQQQLINLYTGSSRFISQNEINEAEALLEYQFVNAMNKMIHPEKPAVAYAVGNGEPEDIRTYDLRQYLSTDFSFYTFNLTTQPVIPNSISALLIVKPSIPFTEDQKLKIDQYVMRGGKVLWFVDNLFAEPDSLAFKPEAVAYDRNLNLTDMLFRYGARINTDLVMDLQCEVIPFVVGSGADGKPQQEFLRWNYYPLFQSANNHPLNRNLGLVGARFANSIDTIQVAGIRKTPLLSSSSSSRTISTPALISLNENKTAPQDENFRKSNIPVAMLLEGKFTSLYNNRVSASMRDSLEKSGTEFRATSEDSKMILVADGDMVLNEFTQEAGPFPMGWNRYTYVAYAQQEEAGKYFVPVANRQFLQNSLEYLIASPAVIETRNKNIVLRMLDTTRVKEQKSTWQLINIAIPVILIVIAGFVYQWLRVRKYSR